MRWKQILRPYTGIRVLGLMGFAGALLTMSMPGNADFKPYSDSRPPVASSDITGGRAFNPPPDGGVPDAPTDTSGGRTCGISQNDLQLTPLAPQRHHIGQTYSPYPTFVWFIPIDTALEGEFQIYAKTETGYEAVLAEPHMFRSRQGFMALTLPDTAAGLQPHTEYVWQVLLRCGSRPGDIHKVRAEVAVVEVSEQPSPDTAETDLQQAEKLGQAGLWYDALAAVSELPLSPDAIAFRRALLLDLADLEAAAEEPLENPENSAVPHSEVLRKIAELD
ncbi:MAG: DUF928 domain-containing protein [Leptolyngbyaceae cyanobacterium]